MREPVLAQVDMDADTGDTRLVVDAAANGVTAADAADSGTRQNVYTVYLGKQKQAKRKFWKLFIRLSLERPDAGSLCKAMSAAKLVIIMILLLYCRVPLHCN